MLFEILTIAAAALIHAGKKDKIVIDFADFQNTPAAYILQFTNSKTGAVTQVNSNAGLTQSVMLPNGPYTIELIRSTGASCTAYVKIAEPSTTLSEGNAANVTGLLNSYTVFLMCE